MDTRCIIRKLIVISLLLISFVGIQAQNGKIDKGRDFLAKALSNTDPVKRSDLLRKAEESFREGGMKQEYNMIIGDAFLEKGDLQNANNYYNRLGKEDKKTAFRKLADAYVDAGFADEKNETKNLNNAMKYYDKSDARKDGSINIGDKFFEKGVKFYTKALDYYLNGKALDKAEMIAFTYENMGGENEVTAAEAYKKINTEDAFKKAGDIYFKRKDFAKAAEAYLAGGSPEGLRKYADYMLSQDMEEEATISFVKLADVFNNRNNTEAIEAMGNDLIKKNEYGIASRVFARGGNSAMANKCKGIDKLMHLDVDSARSLLTEAGETAMVKAINDNLKFLKPISDVAFNLSEMAKGKPYVTMITDPETGKSIPGPGERKVMDDYYSVIKPQVIENVYNLSKNFTQINNTEVKRLIKAKFLKFQPVKRILDPETFSIKLQKNQISNKDIYF